MAVSFAVPDAARDTFAFQPGQYLTLRADIAGADTRRSYSICARGPDRLTVGIKRVPDGRFSTWAQDLRPGARIDVLPPEGRFVLAQDAGRSLLLVAAGSGITPCLAIAAEALRRPDRQVTLLYGNRSTADVMFKREVEALKDAAPDRFRLIHVLSREAQDVPLLHGRIDRDRIERLCAGGILDARSIDTAFLCGPGGMISDVTDALTAAGLPAHAIRSERFSADGARPMQLPPAVAPPAHGAQVEVILDGTRRNLTVDGASDTILSAATEAGLDLPFSCAGGMCCTCRCRVVEGSAAMDVNYALEPWEVEAGFVLACQSRPTSDRLILDFDAA
ncbi:MAG: 2Fe-2S iron-sulfur cluster-binding protein [Pseudomonadota bacterium]